MADERTEAILERFRARGGRVTAARTVVVEALVRGPGHHLTAAEVVARVRSVDPDVHESTVYRNLDALAELGVVTRIEGAGGAVVHHLPEQAHHHLVCERCGRVSGADPELLAAVASQLVADHGFVLREEAVTLPGRCAACVADPTGPIDVSDGPTGADGAHHHDHEHHHHVSDAHQHP